MAIEGFENFAHGTIDDIVIPDEAAPAAAGSDTFEGSEDGADGTGAGEETEIKTKFNPDFDKREDDIIEGVKDQVGAPGDEETVYTGLAGILKDQGFFSNIEDTSTIKDSFALAKAFDEEVKSRLSDRQRELMEYMNAGIPLTKVTQIQSAIADAETITPDLVSATEGLAEKLIKAEFNIKGFSQEDADRYYDLIKSSGKEQEEAIKALSSRKTYLKDLLVKEIKSAKDAKQSEVDKKLNEAKELAKKLESTEVFGRKVTAVSIEKLKSLANTPVAYTKDGEPLNAVMKYKEDNPVDFEHKLLYLYTITNGFKDLSAFDRSAESRLSNELRDSVGRMSSGTGIEHRTVTDRAGVKIDMNTVDDII